MCLSKYMYNNVISIQVSRKKRRYSTYSDLWNTAGVTAVCGADNVQSANSSSMGLDACVECVSWHRPCSWWIMENYNVRTCNKQGREPPFMLSAALWSDSILIWLTPPSAQPTIQGGQGWGEPWSYRTAFNSLFPHKTILWWSSGHPMCTPSL